MPIELLTQEQFEEQVNRAEMAADFAGVALFQATGKRPGSFLMALAGAVMIRVAARSAEAGEELIRLMTDFIRRGPPALGLIMIVGRPGDHFPKPPDGKQ